MKFTIFLVLFLVIAAIWGKWEAEEEEKGKWYTCSRSGNEYSSKKRCLRKCKKGTCFPDSP